MGDFVNPYHADYAAAATAASYPTTVFSPWKFLDWDETRGSATITGTVPSASPYKLTIPVQRPWSAATVTVASVARTVVWGDTPASGEVAVDRHSGVMTFHSDDAGDTVAITGASLVSPVTTSWAHRIQAELIATQTELDTVSAFGDLAKTDGNFIVGDGTNWVVESGATARTSLGLGTGDSPTFNGLTLTNDLAVTHGGTGASSAAAARTNLGAQAENTLLTRISSITPSEDSYLFIDWTTGPPAFYTVSAQTPAQVRTTLGLDTDDDVVFGTVEADSFSLSALNTAPASAAATGTAGEIRIDADYIYVCTATDTWKRVAIATW